MHLLVPLSIAYLPSLQRIVLGPFSLSGDPSIADVGIAKAKSVCQLVMRSSSKRGE